MPCENRVPCVLTIVHPDVEAIAALMVNKTTDVYATPEQLDEQLMTLTLLPRSKWQTLLNLEVIQVRLKPRRAFLADGRFCSNATSRRNRQSHWKAPHSFFRRCQEWSIDSTYRSPPRMKKKAPQGYCRRACHPWKRSLFANLRRKIRKETVSDRSTLCGIPG